MVFQQRNGRVDRYGQTQVPRIGYLLTEPHHERIRGDLRILEILIEKDEQAARNIGDPSAFMGLYDEELEVARVAEVIENNTTAEAFAAQLADVDVDPFEALWSAAAAAIAERSHAASLTAAPSADMATAPTAVLPSLFADNYRYMRDALRWLRDRAPQPIESQIELQFDDAKRTLSLQPNADLARLLDRELAPEMRPRDNQYALCADPALVAAAIDTARDGNDWPQVHYLWPLHPIAQWLDYKLLALFGRQRAPVVRVGQGIAVGEAIVLVLAQVPNRRGQPMLTRWVGIRVDAAGRPQPQTVLTLEEVIELTGLGSAPLANDGRPLDIAPIQAALPAVIQVAERHMKPIKLAFDADCKQRLDCELAKLKTQQGRHFEQLELDFSTGLAQVNAARKRQKEAATADLFAQYQDWIRQTLELDDRAQFTVVAVLIA